MRVIKIKRILSLFVSAVISVAAAPTPMSIAHRGAPTLAPENTEAAFAAAVSAGADAVECDLRLSADGALVCHHDDTTGRVWDADLTVSETPLDRLQSLGLSAGFRLAFPGHRGVRIPTFEQAVEAMGEARIFAEIKGDGIPVARALDAECKRLGITDRVTVISYDPAAVTHMAGLGYDCALLLSCASPTELLSADIPAGVAVDVNYGALTEAAVNELHSRGITVYCYTSEDARTYARLRRMGVDGVTYEGERA